jgi:recombinase
MGSPLADLEREEDDRSGDRDGGPADNPIGDPAGDRGEDGHGRGAGAGVGTGAGWGDRGPRVGIRAMIKARERRHARARDRRAADEGRLARMRAGARARLAGHSLGRPHHSYRPGGGVGGPAGCVRAADLRSEAAGFAMLIRRTSAFEPTWRRRRNDVMCRETISDYQLALRLLALRVRGDVAMLGGHVGRPPYGYLTAPTGRSHPTSGRALVGLIADRQTAHVIPRVFAWRVELGLGPAAIARRLADDPVWAPPPIWSNGEVGSWTAAVVRGILANPRYTGRQLITLPVNGLRKLTPIVHSPLIDDQVFWRAHQPPPAAGAGSSGSEGEDGGRISAPPAGAVQDGHRWWNRDRWFFDHNGPRVID